MKIEILRNGLTSGQVDAARDLFKKVSLRKVCEGSGTNYATVINVLRGKSNKIEVLSAAIDAANVEIARRNNILQSIPGRDAVRVTDSAISN